MAEVKKQFEQALAFKERFEFRLTVGDDIICQRYFRIGNFNPISLKSNELMDTIRGCAETIDNDLKSKSLIYLEIFAPRIFNTMAEFEKYIESEKNRDGLVRGEGVVIREVDDHDFAWNGVDGLIPLSFKFEDGEFSEPLTDEDYVTYKFAFLDYGREVCSATWVGVYPRFVRNSIDLSNRRGKLDADDIYRVGFEQYILYKLVEGRSDLVWKLVKEICYTCSESDDSWYSVTSEYGGGQDGSVYVYNNKAMNNKKIN
jgi:hypothetical protein